MPRLYNPDGTYIEVDHINAYLLPGPDVFVEKRSKPLCEVPPINTGNMANDGGNLLFTEQEAEAFIKREHKAKKFIKRFIGGDEFLNNIPRYCLWLVDATPQELHEMKHVMERVNAVKKFRLESKRAATRKLADTSWLFGEIRQSTESYIAIPETSSETRSYIPMGYLDSSVIPSNALHIIPGATLYHFGVLMSRVHMAWVKTVAGRLKSDYRYSNTLVYNTFPWPNVNDKQRAKIESTAQKILDARAKYPDSSLADLYDPLAMPPELRKAHNENDKAVCEAYGWNGNISDDEILMNLFELYNFMTGNA